MALYVQIEGLGDNGGAVAFIAYDLALIGVPVAATIMLVLAMGLGEAMGNPVGVHKANTAKIFGGAFTMLFVCDGADGLDFNYGV